MNQVFSQQNWQEAHIIEQLKGRAWFTPDFGYLRSFNYIPLFVYDEMKVGGMSNYLLQGSEYLGSGITHGDNFTMMKRFSVVALKNNIRSSSNRGKLVGDVFAVTPEHILAFDRFKSNTKIFKRERFHVLLEEQRYQLKGGKSNKPYLPCYMYIGIPDYWKNTELEDIEPVSIFENKKMKNYFNYKNIRKS